MEQREMYEVIVRSLTHYSNSLNKINDQLKSNHQNFYGDNLIELFGQDLEATSKNITSLIRDIETCTNSSIRQAQLPSIVKQEEKILSASLALYRKHLLELQNIPKQHGFMVELPNMEQELTIIGRVVNQLKLNLPNL